jgi:hypothetical protein
MSVSGGASLKFDGAGGPAAAAAQRLPMFSARH